MGRIFTISTILFGSCVIYFLEFRAYITLKNSLDMIIAIIMGFSFIVMGYYGYIEILPEAKKKKEEKLLSKAVIFIFLSALITTIPIFIMARFFVWSLPLILKPEISNLAIIIITFVLTYLIEIIILYKTRVINRLFNRINKIS